MALTSEQLLKWQEKQAGEETIYQTKKIYLFERPVPIILQNENGPCPLIAICNILLLKNKFDLSPDVTHISERQLLNFVAETLFNSLNNDNAIQPVADAIDFMPSLTTGIHVNVRFRMIDDFEHNKESEIFGLLGIPLVHGWLIDPQDSETANAIGSKSFETLLGLLVAHQVKKVQDSKDVSMKKSEEDNVEVEHSEKENIEEMTKTVDPTSANSDGVISGSSINPNEDVNSSFDVGEFSSAASTSNVNVSEAETIARQDGVISVSIINANEDVGSSFDVGESSSSASTSNVNVSEAETIARQGELVKDFLDNNPTQLTVYGLFCLQSGLQEQELYVFFRNNHFNTMFRFAGELYILVTDEGYMHQPGVVWEKLTEVKGDTVFVNSNFIIFKPGKCEIEEIPESNEKSVKKKDAKTDENDYLSGLGKTAGEGSSSLCSIVQEALELLGIDEKELLGAPPESEEECKPDAETVMKKLEDHLEGIIKTNGISNLNPNLKKVLELLGLDEKELLHHAPYEPETGNSRV